MVPVLGDPAVPEAAASDTLGNAVAVAAELPGNVGTAVVETAQDAFVHAMQLTSGIAAIVAVGLAILAVVALRDHEMPSSDGDEEAESESPTDGGGRFMRTELEVACQ